MDIAQLQVYLTFFMTIFLVVVLYGYAWHLYRSERKGVRDFEKYGRLALDDSLDSAIVEDKPASKREYEEEK